MSDQDFSQKLDQVLSDPARMAQIAALAKSFAGGGMEKTPSCDGDVSPRADASPLSFLPPAFLRDWREHAGERIALLSAVRPFLEPDRRAKVDRVLSLLKTLDLLTLMQ